MTTPVQTQDAGVGGGSPFQPATQTDRRLKLFLWGDSGVGKTTLALRFPSPVVIDLEDGCALYGGAFAFAVLKTSTADEVIAAVDWLLTHPHDYRTLVIDPITIFWEALQAKWNRIFLMRNRGGKGHRGDFYELQPRDWVTLKAEFKEFVRKLIALDLNVVVTARLKTQYSDSGFMRAVGESFDAEKSLPYLFDSILHLYRGEGGQFMAENIKDRTNRLPRGRFEVSYELIEQSLGSEALAREAKPVALATPEQIARIRHFIGVFGMKEEQVVARLAAYGASCVAALTTENAQLIIDKFTAAAAAKAAPNTSHVQ